MFTSFSCTFLRIIVISNPCTFSFGVSPGWRIGDHTDVIIITFVLYCSQVFYTFLTLTSNNDHSHILISRWYHLSNHQVVFHFISLWYIGISGEDRYMSLFNFCPWVRLCTCICKCRCNKCYHFSIFLEFTSSCLFTIWVKNPPLRLTSKSFHRYPTNSVSNLTFVDVRFLVLYNDRWWFSVLLYSFTRRDLWSLPRIGTCVDLKTERPGVFTLSYLKLTKFDNTITQCRQDLLLGSTPLQ